jgi:hypothetical protein
VPREKQIEFPPNQTHDPRVTTYMMAICVAFIVIVVVILLTDLDGPFFGPY